MSSFSMDFLKVSLFVSGMKNVEKSNRHLEGNGIC